MSQKQILETKAEICEYLGWGWQKVLRLIKRQGLPVVKIEGRWQADTARLDEWLSVRLAGRAQ